MEALNEQDWRRLILAIQRRQCVLLLGPGIAVAPDDGEAIPLRTRLAQMLADKLPPDEVSNRDELSHVLQVYHHQPGIDRCNLEWAVQELYALYDNATTPLHQELAKLPFTLCVNTTFDSFFLNALRSVDKTPVYDFYHFRKKRDPYLTDTDSEHPIVYDLYGNRGEGDSLVLTENDLLEFLINVVRGIPPLPPLITARFRDLDTSFLFLGFGFRYWYVRILLHVLQTYSHRSRSLALEDACFFTNPEQRQTVVFYEKAHCIGFRQQSWESFATELRRRYEASISSVDLIKRPLPAEAPSVFLCHNHPDREEVEKLVDQLHAFGIGTWLDRQNLRGGDNWERQIPRVIQKQVDYVVVLQSSRMLGKVESYFHKEINEALERQKGFDEGFRFVIPAQLEHGVLLEKLAHLHTVDLTLPQGLKELADTILEDWNRRGRQRTP